MRSGGGRSGLLAGVLGFFLFLAPPVSAKTFPPTEIAQDVTLSQAAQAGIVGLKAKGGFGGDVVAVDLTGARIPGHPVTVRVRIEFWGADKAGNPWPPAKAAQIEGLIEGRLSGLRGSDGTPVAIDVVPRLRGGGDPPTPGYHQIKLEDVPPESGQKDTSQVNAGEDPSGVRTGQFGANEGATTYAHETLHLLGFKDRYLATEPDLLVDGKRYPLPKFKGSKSDSKALDEWFKSVLDAEKKLEEKLGEEGKLVPGVPPGHADDLLANTHSSTSTLLEADIDDLIARAGVHLFAKPGDLVAGKDGGTQNLGVGAPLELFAPRGGSAHADGLYAYCIDFHRTLPRTGLGFDVLGPARGLGSSQLESLQRVLEVVGQAPDPNDFALVGAAQSAVWAVTDGEEPTPEGGAILDAAGVTFDKAHFSSTPHFTDPNAGTSETAAVTPTGVLPRIPVDSSPGPTDPIDGIAGKPRLLSAEITRRRVREAVISLVLDRAPDSVRIGLQGGGRRTQRGLGSFGAQIGPNEIAVRLPKSRFARGRLLLRGTGWKRSLKLQAPRRGH